MESKKARDKQYDFVATITATSTIWGCAHASCKEDAKELIEDGQWTEIYDEEAPWDEGDIVVHDEDIDCKEDDEVLREKLSR
jgi:hypothetical protein